MNGWKIKLFFVLLLSVGMFGCAPGNDDQSSASPRPAPTPESIPTKNVGEAQKIIASTQVTCPNSKECSASVGMLAAAWKKKAQVCTAFLIADDIVATNSHCVPDDLRKSGSSCNGRIAILFPELEDGNVNYSREQVDCAQVISASEINGTDFTLPDFAFLKLTTPIKRPHLQITRDGFAENHFYEAIKIDPDQSHGILAGTMRKTKCKAIYNSMVAGRAMTANAPVMGLGDCAIIHGNSGSPLLDSSGQVSGVLFAEVEKQSILDGIKKHPALSARDSDISALALATNFSCIQLPISSEVASGCHLPVVTKVEDRNATSVATAQLNLLASEAASKLDSSLQWRLIIIKDTVLNKNGAPVNLAGAQFGMLVPSCIRNQEAFLNGEKTPNWRDDDPTVDRPIETKIWIIDSGFNRYLQSDVRITPIDSTLEGSMLMHYTPNDVITQGQSRMQIGTELSISMSAPLFEGDLSVCGK